MTENFCTPYGKIDREDIGFYRREIKANKSFLETFKREPEIKNSVVDRHVVMHHQRYLLKKYYGLEDQNLTKPIKVADVQLTENFAYDNFNNLKKPSYKELCALYLNVVETNDQTSLRAIISRLEQHKKAAMELQTCPVCLKYKPRGDFKLMSYCGHISCASCIDTIETQAWRYGRQRRDSGDFDCPVCFDKVFSTFKIFYV